MKFAEWIESTVVKDPVTNILDKLHYLMDHGHSLSQGAWLTNADIRELIRTLDLARAKIKQDLSQPRVYHMYIKFLNWEKEAKPISLIKAVKNGGNIQEPIARNGEIAVSQELFDLLRIMNAWRRLKTNVGALTNRIPAKTSVRDFYVMLLVIQDYLTGQYSHSVQTPSF